MSPFVKIDEIKNFNLLPGFNGKLIHTDLQTIAFWKIDKDSILPEHHHIHEQISMVTKGELELTIGGETKTLTTGMVAVIPSNISHSGKAITACEVTDIFSPARAEYQVDS